MFKYSKAFSAFSVDDLKKAESFYGETLGLKTELIDKKDYQLLDIYVSGDTKIQVYPKPDHVPATFTILYFLVDNVEQTVDDLAAKGITFEHYDEPGLKTDAKGINAEYGTPPKAWFKDPAGNFLSIIEKV